MLGCPASPPNASPNGCNQAAKSHEPGTHALGRSLLLGSLPEPMAGQVWIPTKFSPLPSADPTATFLSIHLRDTLTSEDTFAVTHTLCRRRQLGPIKTRVILSPCVGLPITGVCLLLNSRHSPSLPPLFVQNPPYLPHGSFKSESIWWQHILLPILAESAQ